VRFALLLNAGLCAVGLLATVTYLMVTRAQGSSPAA